MGKRLIIKGADFSNVAASVEPILNPLKVLSVGQGGNWTTSYMEDAPIGSYCVITNTGALMIMTSLGLQSAVMPEDNNSLDYENVTLVKREGETRYDVAYPDEFEKITFDDGYYYPYNSEQNTEPQKTANGGVRCAHVHLSKGDVIVLNVEGGTASRAIWVMKTDYSSTIKVADAGSVTTYAPICYIATEECEVFINDSSKAFNSYILRK